MKKTSGKVKILIVAALLACAAALAVFFFFFNGREEENNFFKEYYDAKVAEFTEENKTLSDVDIAFVGDSITDGYEQFGAAYSEYKVAWRGIGGDTTFGLYDRLEVSLYAVAPKIVVLLIGINNIDTMFENYEEIVADIRKALPEAEIIIQSLHPTSKDFSHFNEKIPSTNEKIKDICDRYSCLYVDVNTELTDPQTGEYSALYTDDGLHPNAKGYEKITEILLPVIEEKLK